MILSNRSEAMGKITTSIVITNRLDQGMAEKGLIPPEQVRSITINHILVDTGATTLCLPKKAIATLGLKLLKTVVVTTANGVGEARIFEDAKITLRDREGTFECIELSDDAEPLLGVIPLESLGVELDLAHQQIHFLPLGPQASYLRI